jgi:hypothetical protein
MNNSERSIYYFAPLDPLAALLQRIKGEYRRYFVDREAKAHGVESVPEAWRDHDLSEVLKGFLQARDPRMRGGEDLPDLAPGEVEVARLVLLDSVHGEVTSLRARRLPRGRIGYTLVDEYDNTYELPIPTSKGPLTDEEVLRQFRHAAPSPMDTECAIGFRSVFHPGLDELAKADDGEEDDSDEDADDDQHRP